MTAKEPAIIGGATARADLLRLLAVRPRDMLTLDVDESGWFGYVRQREQDPKLPPIVGTLDVTLEAATAGAPPVREGPLRLPFQHAIVQREPRARPQSGTHGTAATELGLPLDPVALKANPEKRTIHYEDLVPQARLLPALRRQLGATRLGALDLKTLTKQVASCQLQRRLPRRVLRRWHPDLVVVLDFASRLWPYREDMHRLAERLLCLVGRSGVSLRIMEGGPLGRWSDWVAHQDRQTREEPPERSWTMPPPGTPVLLVSDLGLLLGPDSPQAQAWARFISVLTRAETRPLALVPLGAGQLGAPVPASMPVVRWSPDAPPHPIHSHGVADPTPDGLVDLLAMVAATRRVDPPLLRAMRRLNPAQPLNAGLEGALWCHPDIEAGFTASIKADSRSRHLDRFSALLPLLQRASDELRRVHHAHLRAVLEHEETLVWAKHCDPILRRDATARVKAACEFLARLPATAANAKRQDSVGLWNMIEGIVFRADGDLASEFPDAFYVLLAAILRRQGKDAVVPEWADPAHLGPLLDPDRSSISCWLVRDAASGSLMLQGGPPGERQTPLGEPLQLDAGGLKVTAEGRVVLYLQSAADLPCKLVRLTEPGELRIETSRESIVVGAVRRPLGALSWGCDEGGLMVRSPKLGAYDMVWRGDALRAVGEPGARTLEADTVSHPDANGALRFGIDARFGVYAELNIATRNGTATQRLRWIEPGAFLMGSPETEVERGEAEGPQHAVRIGEGYWLFDTPCTQALWQAVMGNNPSEFKSPDRPVEQVSWEDVQKFLKQINALVPGLELTLPSEAQWEYACRAGSETAIYTGKLEIPGVNNGPALDPIAWYGGNSGAGFELENGYDSSGWPEKQYPHNRAGTHPVAKKTPNAWGLYDMLGNVWEWCADEWHGNYQGAPTDGRAWQGAGNPGASRVVRGGSWFSNARYVRSAYRLAHDPGSRDDFIGFRCARVQGVVSSASKGPEAPKPRKKRRGRRQPPEAAA